MPLLSKTLFINVTVNSSKASNYHGCSICNLWGKSLHSFNGVNMSNNIILGSFMVRLDKWKNILKELLPSAPTIGSFDWTIDRKILKCYQKVLQDHSY